MKLIRINPADNVAVAAEPVFKGESLKIGGICVTARSDAGFGHKIALYDIPKGGVVIKYGCPIGYAKESIKSGEHAHTHNIKTGLGDMLTYQYAPVKTPGGRAKASGGFMGFKRSGGGVGIRNEIWIIPTVGCVNLIGAEAAQKAQSMIRKSVTGVYHFSHPYGCSQLGTDHENTKKALCGLIKHPNAGGVLVLGLGCENNGISGVKEYLGEFDPDRIKFLNCQDYEDEISAALEMIDELIETACRDSREQAPVSALTVGLKCGGSDGFSGITANPLVGRFADKLIFGGGSAILTEVPEMFGSEELLMSRCKNEEVFLKTVSLINDFKAYFASYNQPVYENPSPGNKAGGISTLEEKALGCTQKCGASAVNDVLSYGEQLREKGLNLLNAPGNDIVAATALAVSGAQIVLFTTGRGTPLAPPVPTVKISSNTPLFEKKRGWMDFDAGRLLAGQETEELAQELYARVIKLANGECRTKSELSGTRDIALFKTGVTL